MYDKITENEIIIVNLMSDLNIIEYLFGAIRYIGAEPIVMMSKNPSYPGKYDIPAPILAAI